MRSDNPNSGIYEANTSRTLDGNGGNPSCNQGGMAVVALQGSMIGREDKNGPMGSGVNDDVCFTLNTIDKHAVAYDCRNHAASDISATLQSKNNGGQSLNFINPVMQAGAEYTVRRLVPKECAMLQGFEPDWCENLGTAEPTEADIAWWTEVFETHRRIMGTSGKPKSRNQIVKWLQDPHSDAAEYKMWGNGVALPCVRFVMAGIVWAVREFPVE
jgi:DNA (cytosine-5)-methyltransferase 1